MSNNVRNAAGMSFLSWLCLAFIVLKLTGFIAWSWWWVLAPIWIPLALVALVLIIVWPWIK